MADDNKPLAPFRVRIIGATHPHKGVTGTFDLTDHIPSTGQCRVTFDEPHHGVEAAYAAATEVRELFDA